jgi:hypothetical protein
MKNKQIKINISNHWFYFLTAIGVILIISVGIYALTPGVAPNPGHLISELSSPSGCLTGQFLQWAGANWTCIGGNITCPSGTHIVINTYANGKEDVYGSTTSVSCSSLPTDTCDGSINAYACSVSDSKTCTDVVKTAITCPPQSQCIGGYTCTKRTITCKLAGILCGE